MNSLGTFCPTFIIMKSSKNDCYFTVRNYYNENSLSGIARVIQALGEELKRKKNNCFVWNERPMKVVE